MVMLFIVMGNACTDVSSCFLKKLFDFSYPQEEVYDIRLSSNTDVPQHKILGYGDFNNDLRADYAAADNFGNILVFYYQKDGDLEGQYILTYTAELFVDCAPVNTYLCIFDWM